MLGVVVDVDDHPAGVGIGQPAHVTAQRESRAARRPRLGGQVHFDCLTGGQGPLGGVPCLLVELTVAHQAELASPGIDQDHVLVLVDDDNPGRRMATMRSSIWETVRPVWATSEAFRWIDERREYHTPSAAPTASAASAAVATRRADAAVTRKAYAFGERHPSSVRLNAEQVTYSGTGVRPEFTEYSPIGDLLVGPDSR
ncbi:Uncharacterised protein [Mycobacteroides abscessus]|nr:Uncharacterised protein [Mycobacteroides abscessus]